MSLQEWKVARSWLGCDAGVQADRSTPKLCHSFLVVVTSHTESQCCWPAIMSHNLRDAVTHRLPNLQTQVVEWLLLLLARVVPAQQQQKAPWTAPHVLQGQGTTQVYNLSACGCQCCRYTYNCLSCFKRHCHCLPAALAHRCCCILYCCQTLGLCLCCDAAGCAQHSLPQTEALRGP